MLRGESISSRASKASRATESLKSTVSKTSVYPQRQAVRILEPLEIQRPPTIPRSDSVSPRIRFSTKEPLSEEAIKEKLLLNSLEIPKRKLTNSYQNTVFNQEPVDAFNLNLSDYRFVQNLKPLIALLRKRTKFCTKEIESLLLLFHRFTGRRDVMLKEEFVNIMSKTWEMHDEFMSERVVTEILKNTKLKRYVTMYNWVEVFSLFLRGSMKDKMKFCFGVYDISKKGYIGREVVYVFLERALASDVDLTYDFLDIVMKKMDLDRDGKLSFDDYKQTVLRNPCMLEFLGQCLPERQVVYRMLTTFAVMKKHHEINI